MDTILSFVINNISQNTVIIIGILGLLYTYLTWNFGYWRKRGIPSDRPWPIIGTLQNPFNPVPIEVHDQNAYKKHGRICGLYEGRYPGLYVADPDLIRTIFIKDFHVFPNRRNFTKENDTSLISKFLNNLRNEKWKSLRNTLSPTFSTGKIKQMSQLIEECAEQLNSHLRNYAEKNLSIDAREWFGAYSMDVTATCAFGTKIDSMGDKNNEFVKHAKQVFGAFPKWLILIFIVPKFLRPYIFGLAPQFNMDYLANTIGDVIKARENEKQPRRDFLQLLLEAKIESEKNQAVSDESKTKDIKEQLKSPKLVLTEDHVKAQAVLFLIGGFETTSIAMSFVAYSLALNENVQDKLIKEIDSVFHKYEGKFSYEMIADMQYLDMVISEALRMYPPTVRLERVCEEDGYKLGNVVLNKGDYVYIPVYAMHHDEEFYPKPHIFDPERFSPKNKGERNPYTYLPFGDGPRNCIGMRFAMMAMKIGIIYTLREFKFKVCSETQIPFKRKPMTFFLMPESIDLKLEPRQF